MIHLGIPLFAAISRHQRHRQLTHWIIISPPVAMLMDPRYWGKFFSAADVAATMQLTDAAICLQLPALSSDVIAD
jgi:hypothetical protein